MWPIPNESGLWKNPHGHYHRSNRGGGQWEHKKKYPERWTISYKNLKFNISPTGFKHTGLFPEQAANWDWAMDKIENAKRPIIMDPPSYGRGPKGEVWQIEEKLYGLVELCTKVLSDEPLFFLINSYTTGLSPIILEHILDATVAKKAKGGKIYGGEIGIPTSRDGKVLPCGIFGRWESK